MSDVRKLGREVELRNQLVLKITIIIKSNISLALTMRQT